MGSPSVSLSYGARREMLAQLAPRYQEATGAQKMLLLDRVVEVTGYARKYAICLLNHLPECTTQILRPRLPIYGSAVQEALFLAWRTIQYPCAQRLVPCLPSLIPVLERDGHLQLDEEHRCQLLTMSIRTAERLLSTQRRPTPHGISTTKPGTLLKHQIPIRTFVQWDDHRPGFLEADLVAHCGGNVFGGYLYTLTLTDIATGWTECIPVLNRSPETVLAAIKHARRLFPFPLLGLDTDHGSEFLNAVLLSYCQQEQLTFTRSRPECSNDNCHVEQKNGAVVRKLVGHDRLVSMLAYQQLGELYQAARLLVNCFQPSMKLQSKHMEGEHARRIYDEAKTPWQRVLLSGVLSEEKQQEWREAVESLDPLRLVQQVEALQRAIWRCAEDGPGTALVRFSLDACVSTAARLSSGNPSDMFALGSADLDSVRDWSRSMDDPFLGEWEHIHAFVRARPMASAGEILREWQQRFPERFVDAHLSILQRRLREIRASLVAPQAEPGRDQVDGVIASCTASEPLSARPDLSPGADGPRSDAPTVMWPDPAAGTKEPPPTSEEKTRSARRRQISVSEVSSSRKETECKDTPTVQELLAVGSADGLPTRMITIDYAISLFLQGEHARGWEPKTREWHETSLGQVRRYVVWRKLLLLSSLTSSELRGWLTFLRTEALVTGAFRVQSTISTYARSVHAFCAWLVEQGYLEQSPLPACRSPRERGDARASLSKKPFNACLTRVMQRKQNNLRRSTLRLPAIGHCSGRCGTRGCWFRRCVR